MPREASEANAEALCQELLMAQDSQMLAIDQALETNHRGP